MGFHKVSGRWVPRQLTPELKERGVDACEELLRRYEIEGDAFLQRIETGDESWVHYFQPETKRASRVSPFNFTEAQKIPHTAFRWESDADALLG